MQTLIGNDLEKFEEYNKNIKEKLVDGLTDFFVNCNKINFHGSIPITY